MNQRRSRSRRHIKPFRSIEPPPTFHRPDPECYYRRIIDPHQDDEVIRLLRNCLVSYPESYQLAVLERVANSSGCALIDVLTHEEALREAHLDADQQVNLATHLDLLRRFTPESSAADVAATIRELPNSPFDTVLDQPDRLKDVDQILEEARGQTVREMIARIDRHVAFLDANRSNTDLVVTTVDNAKGEEFDTVVILGPNHLFRRTKLRLYVSLSRARDRPFLVCDERQGPSSLLSSVPRELYATERWVVAPPPPEDGTIPF